MEANWLVYISLAILIIGGGGWILLGWLIFEIIRGKLDKLMVELEMILRKLNEK